MSLRIRIAAALVPAVLSALVLLTLASAAAAHPLGNFTINRLDVVRISADRVDVRYILDQAEIPTFQERGREPSALLAAKRAEVRRGLTLLVAGAPARLALRGPGRFETFPGQGGLRTTRVELLLTSPAVGAREVELRDSTFADRVGWRDVVIQPGSGTAVRSSVAASEPTDRLRRYPTALLQAPPDRRSARFEVRAGDGTVEAPGGARAELGSSADRGAGGFGGLIDDAGTGEGLLVVLLLAAFGWGALHALSPGHGKTMVAAYLVGSRGSVRDAVVLGGAVTVSHTIGVFALGFITLALSDYVLPEDLYPWLNLVAGALILGVGLYVLRSRADGHGHHHGHAHGHGHGHGHGHASDHDHDHDHGHLPAGRRSVIALGASAGLVPCPSALVVLLGAISQQEVALGLILILAFSLGLATTLTVLGLAVVWSAGRVARMRPRAKLGRVLAIAPTVSALVIVALGCVLVARALPTVV